ncbi:MAG: hypothetical protein ABSB94_18270, partial [Syntrophorhabdales bacterium]
VWSYSARLRHPFFKERRFVYAFNKSIVSEKGFASQESKVNLLLRRDTIKVGCNYASSIAVHLWPASSE